jgi:lipopolysaccharide transport system permease protein
MAGVIEGFRWSLTGRGTPPGHLIVVSSVVVAIMLVSGVAYFQSMETTMADVA